MKVTLEKPIICMIENQIKEISALEISYKSKGYLAYTDLKRLTWNIWEKRFLNWNKYQVITLNYSISIMKEIFQPSLFENMK